MGCNTEAVLTFSPALEEPGKYVVAVVADGDEYECRASVPVHLSNEEEECSEGMWSILEGPQATSNSGDRIEGPARYLAGVSLDGRFEHVELTLLMDHTVLAAEQSDLHYTATEPNGPRCGFCEQAEHTVVVP
jgi:hypothetical protein